jgi:hypothetical protein
VGRYHLEARRKFRKFGGDGIPGLITVSQGRDLDIEEIKPAGPVILMVRELRNMLVSRHKKVGIDHPMTNPGIVPIWCKYAKQALGIENYFNVPCIAFIYDWWFASSEYRTELIRSINKTFGWSLLPKDPGLGSVSAIGGGSSFDGNTYYNEPERMQVLARWQYYKQYAEVAKLITAEAREINNALIGELNVQRSSSVISQRR